MNRFNPSARKVRDTSLPLEERTLALRWCVRQYCRLTGDDMVQTFDRLNRLVGVDLEVNPSPEQLEAALTILIKERTKFLSALGEFTKTRRVEKGKGQRQPRQNQGVGRES